MCPMTLTNRAPSTNPAMMPSSVMRLRKFPMPFSSLTLEAERDAEPQPVRRPQHRDSDRLGKAHLSPRAPRRERYDDKAIGREVRTTLKVCEYRLGVDADRDHDRPELEHLFLGKAADRPCWDGRAASHGYVSG